MQTKLENRQGFFSVDANVSQKRIPQRNIRIVKSSEAGLIPSPDRLPIRMAGNPEAKEQHAKLLILNQCLFFQTS
ncbi:MAG: hypothetical protein IKD69_08755, partial [Solobacterium sp.]|nr:hypothetical protein [Solobacterium sp.]